MAGNESAPRAAVSAAQKYDELGALGQERPRCACHDRPQVWNANPRYRAGGTWVCAVVLSDNARRWRAANQRPHCSCHGEPSNRNGIAPSGRRKHRCAVKDRARKVARHAA